MIDIVKDYQICRRVRLHSAYQANALERILDWVENNHYILAKEKKKQNKMDLTIRKKQIEKLAEDKVIVELRQKYLSFLPEHIQTGLAQLLRSYPYYMWRHAIRYVLKKNYQNLSLQIISNITYCSNHSSTFNAISVVQNALDYVKFHGDKKQNKFEHKLVAIVQEYENLLKQSQESQA
jgi:ABC-type lipopolysaccharide export system ATPase subunit